MSALLESKCWTTTEIRKRDQKLKMEKSKHLLNFGLVLLSDLQVPTLAARIEQMATDILFIEVSSNEHKQSITNCAHRNRSNVCNIKRIFVTSSSSIYLINNIHT